MQTLLLGWEICIISCFIGKEPETPGVPGISDKSLGNGAEDGVGIQ